MKNHALFFISYLFRQVCQQVNELPRSKLRGINSILTLQSKQASGDLTLFVIKEPLKYLDQ